MIKNYHGCYAEVVFEPNAVFTVASIRKQCFLFCFVFVIGIVFTYFEITLCLNKISTLLTILLSKKQYGQVSINITTKKFECGVCIGVVIQMVGWSVSHFVTSYTETWCTLST